MTSIARWVIFFYRTRGKQLGIGFEVAGFGAALWEALVMSLVSLALTLLIRGEEKEKERPRWRF